MSTPSRQLPYKPRLSGPERRALIEAAAVRLFAEQGYSGTSLEQVAAAAGISRPVIYDHFPSKRALHDALVASHTRDLMVWVAERVGRAPADPEIRLRTGVDAFFEFVENHPYAWRMIFREPLVEGTVTVLDDQIQVEVTTAIAELLRQLAGEGKPAWDSAERLIRFAESLRWICNGLAAWWYEHRGTTRQELVQTVMDLCWSGLGQQTAKS